ncbi:MAG: class I SAM-dependent methyltransferase [Patescibacteria group bacterium]|nr:class I SAM-dependent methyltransferase [Patescibacteria group bacterium]
MPSYYDDTSFDYPEFWQGRKYEDLAEKLALEKLIAKIPDNFRKSLLDVGAGFGRLAEVYAGKFDTCFLVDPSKKLLFRGKKNLSGKKNLRFLTGTGEKIPFKKKKFDLVLIVRVFHHIRKPKKTFCQVFRILRPGGFFIFEYANKAHFKARFLNFFKRKRPFLLEPADIRSRKNLKRRTIPFINYHPDWVQDLIKKFGFSLVEKLSVSNFRSGILKRLLPCPILLFMERNSQKLLGKIDFGPSIFVLLQKPSK